MARMYQGTLPEMARLPISPDVERRLRARARFSRVLFALAIVGLLSLLRELLRAVGVLQ